MRKEGRPRGMVRTFNILPEQLNPRPAGRVLNKVDTPPTAGLFMKVSTKPTSHSKFTGKSDHIIYSTTKSKDKSKGSYKLRSVDHKLSYKVINWTLLPDDRSDKRLVAGHSASKILDDLYEDHHLSYDHDDDYDYNLHDDDGGSDERDASSCDVLDIDEKGAVVVMGDDIIVHGGVMPDDDDGYQGFYDISGVFSVVVDDEDDDEGDDGWSLVGGM
ncbi:hypothetical protein RND81_10G065400 [Saponaria officinalis]|uniref:Uncharacterized protein n=1 Tax=Saponaria officinalis TaxID=3572 RepID=A0AAW1HZ50_SAPOF